MPACAAILENAAGIRFDPDRRAWRAEIENRRELE
jgi:hypothetical protein